MHISISLRSGARGLQKLPVSKHYSISKITIFGTPSSTPVGDRHMRPLTFLYEIESWTTFIWNLFWYNVYVWQYWALKWIYFPVSIHCNILMTGVFGALCSTLVGDKHKRSVTFLSIIESWTTFIWRFFWYDAYFWQHRVLKWIYLALFVHFNISKMAIYDAS